MTFQKPIRLATTLMLATILASCASHEKVNPPGTLTPSAKTIPCVSIKKVVPNRGKPDGANTEDISAALDRDHPIERVRNLVGDTSATIRQTDANNAAIEAVCESDKGEVSH